MRIEKRGDGFVVYQDDKPVLVNKGLNFAVPNKIKIFGIDRIPTKLVLKAILVNDYRDLIANIDQLGVDYQFKYIPITGISVDSIKLTEEYFKCF